MSTENRTADQDLLRSISAQLLDDVQELQRAYSFADTTLQRFLRESAGGDLVEGTTVELAVWAFARFRGDETQFNSFLEKYRERRRDHGNTLFGFDSPYRDD